MQTRFQSRALGYVCRRQFWSAYKKFINYSMEPVEQTTLYPSKQFSSWTTFKIGETKCSTEVLEEDGQQFLRFAGNIPSIKMNSVNEIQPKSGFCAIRAETRRSVDLRDHEGLELVIRSNRDLSFALNMGCFTMVEGDVYQIPLEIRGGAWTRMQVPFSLFRVLFEGLERVNQRVNDSLQVESLGFLVTSKSDLSFEIDIKAIAAIPTIDRSLVSRALQHNFQAQESSI